MLCVACGAWAAYYLGSRGAISYCAVGLAVGMSLGLLIGVLNKWKNGVRINDWITNDKAFTVQLRGRNSLPVVPLNHTIHDQPPFEIAAARWANTICILFALVGFLGAMYIGIDNSVRERKPAKALGKARDGPSAASKLIVNTCQEGLFLPWQRRLICGVTNDSQRRL